MTLSIEDVLVAARTIFGEARGEPYEGQKAVAHVILNRARKEGSVAAACLRPKQFSCWNVGDPTRERMVTVTTDDPKFRTAIRAFLDAVDELDFTGGATHYCTLVTYPKWAKDQVPDFIIGNHKFWRNIA
jgi:spore germination cell wall hydrolase CwlJ-like protein